MKQIISITLFFLSLTFLSKAQSDLTYKNYNWETNPKVYTPQKNEDSLSYVNVKEKTVIEYTYETSGELIMFVSTHIIIHFNTTKGIEEKNKVYIRTGNIVEMMDLKARTISKDGKVTNLPASAIKKTDNLENQGPFTYFAMEGLEPGCDIEYMYTKKMNPYIYGGYTLQSSHPKNMISYEIISPQNLIFEAKSYNGLPAFVKDTTLPKKNKISVTTANIKAITEEKYSALDASKMKFSYKLAYNYSKSRARLYTFELAGADFYKRYFEVEKADAKMASKILKKANVTDNMSDEEKARKLETFLKSNVYLEKDAKSLAFKDIIENKMANNYDMNRLYINCFKEAGLEVELVITCDRFDDKFDAEFDTWGQFEDIMLYLPKQNVYIAPTNILSRYEFMPPELSNNKGLFIKEVAVGDLKSGTAKVKTIGFADYKKSSHIQDCEVSFKAGSMIPQIKNVTSLTGYSAYYTQPYYYLLNKEQQEKMMSNQVKVEGEESTIISSKIENTLPDEILVKPFVITSQTEANQLLEKAGKKLIFKVGDLIGPQAEMYQEGERITNPEIYYTHAFIRKLKIKIPDGYKLINEADINKEVKYNTSDNPPCQFTVTHQLKGNELIIDVYEDYRVLNYPLADYEKFKKVINASADFNKLSIIFEN